MSITESPGTKKEGEEMGNIQVAITDQPIAVSFEKASQLTSISKNSLRRARLEVPGTKGPDSRIFSIR
jgi:hypothetical protein